MTVPVSESSDERKLRRLVDAINANAGTANTNTSTPRRGDNGNGGGRSSASNESNGSSRSSRTLASSKSPPKLGSKRNGDPAPARGVQRSPPGKGRGQHVSPKSGRSRARTNDDAAIARAREEFSPAPSQRLGSRRATWTGSGGAASSKGQREKEEEEEGSARPLHPHLVSNASAATATSAAATAATKMRGMRGQAGGEEEEEEGRSGRGVPWGSATATWIERKREGEEREPAGGGVDGERGAITLGRPARRQHEAEGGESIHARPRHEEEEEDSLPIQDRLQAVMKDLGVLSGEQEQEQADPRESVGRRRA